MIYINTTLKGLPETSSENSQHLCLAGAYLMSGCIDILDYYKFMPLPYGFNFLSLVVPATVETFIFSQHLDGIQIRNQHMHALMVYLSILKAICAVIELVNPKSIKAAFGRCFFTLMQGTWFTQIGFSLFYETWSKGSRDYTEVELSKEQTMKSMLYFNACFVWHFFVDLVIFLALVLSICKYFQRKSAAYLETGSVECHNLLEKSRKNGHLDFNCV